MIDLHLEGQVAIVTGASRGLGQAAVLALVEEGVRVLAVARSLDALKKLEALAPEHIRARQCDMKDTEAVAKLPDQAIEAFGGLDIVVNNAGIAPAGALRLIAITSSQTSSSCLRKKPAGAIPALLTTISSPPKASIA